MSGRSQQPGPSRARLVLPVAGAGLLIACGIVLMKNEPEQITVSAVSRQIQQIAITAAAPDAPNGAGVIGPWRIAALHFDPLTGELHDFTLRSGNMYVGAERAKLIVDPATDSFSFELVNVTLTRAPKQNEPDDEAFVHELATHTLGPAPYGMDIVADGGVIDNPPRIEHVPIVQAGDVQDER